MKLFSFFLLAFGAAFVIALSFNWDRLEAEQTTQSTVVPNPVMFEQTSISGLEINTAGMDLGNIAPGLGHEGEFVLRNIGNTPIAIDQVTTDCGCAVIRFSPTVLEMGDTLEVPVVYKADTLGGTSINRRAIVKVRPDGQSNSRVVVANLTGYVERSPAIQFVPGIVNFENLTAGKDGMVDVRFIGDEAFLTALPDRIDVLIGERVEIEVDSPVPSGTRGEKIVEVHGLWDGSGEIGKIDLPLTISDRNKRFPGISIRIKANLTQNVLVQPERILVMQGKDKSGEEPTFLVVSLSFSDDDGAPQIGEIHTDLLLEVTRLETRPGVARLGVRLLPNLERPSGSPRSEKGEILVSIHGEDEPIRIPVTVFYNRDAVVASE